MNTFSLRIVNVDYCLVKPNPLFDDLFSDFCERETSLVPVIRIFGITRQGKKGCLHVHGYYPYLTIPFDPERHISVPSFKKKLAEEFNKLLSSTNTNYFKTRSAKNYNYVYRIESIKAIPFYGYYSTERTFLRIFFYNPMSVEKAKTLLENGKVMNTAIQTYEAHMPYILKFFVDYNLYGMNFIDVRNVQYRYMENNVYNSDKSTTCEIEGDCIAANIVNKESMSTDGQNPGLKLMWEEERNRRQMNCLSSQITPQSSQERGRIEITSKEKSFLILLRNILSLKSEEENYLSPSGSQCKNFTASDFARIFVDCVNSQSSDSNGHNSQQQKYTNEEVTEIFSQFTQSRKRSQSENSDGSSSKSSGDSNENNCVEYSEILMEMIRGPKNPSYQVENSTDVIETNRASQVSNASNKSYTAEDFVKIMVGYIKDNEPKDDSETNKSYTDRDFAEIMMEFNNVKGVTRISEEDDSKITEEMSQVFTSVHESNTTKTNAAAQTSPLDLATTPPPSNATENCSDYSGFEEVGSHSHKHDTLNEVEADNNEFIEVVCDCKVNECCDLCCDRRSDLCDCEGDQCTKIPQLDGCFDDETSKIEPLEHHSYVQRRPTNNTYTFYTVLKKHSSNVAKIENSLRIPQVDGSWDVTRKSDKSRKKKKLQTVIKQLPFTDETLECNHDVKPTTSTSMVTQKRKPQLNGFDEDERKLVNILGNDVRIPKMLNKSLLKQIGYERLIIKKLSARRINKILRQCETNLFDEEDRFEFYRTKLKGKEKRKHLLSLCTPLEVVVDGDDSISQWSNETIIDIEETSYFSDMREENSSELTLKSECDKKLTHSIDTILHNSPNKYDYDDEDFIPPTPEYAQQNNENELSLSSREVLNEEDETQDYWKNDSPMKLDSSPIKPAINNQKEYLESEISTQKEINISEANKEVNETEIHTQIPKYTSEGCSRRPETEAEIYTQNEVCDIRSQESNKSEKSVSQCSKVSISDSIVSFYEMESPFSSPVTDNSKIFDLSISPIKLSLSKHLSKACSTPLESIKEKEVLRSKKKRSLSVDFEKEQSNSQKRKSFTKERHSNQSVIEDARNSQGHHFELSSVEENSQEMHNHQYITVMSLEVFTSVHVDLKPNPSNDAIRAIFYAIHKDIPENSGKSMSVGMIVVEMDETDFQSHNNFDFNSTKMFRKHLLRTGFSKDYVTVTYAVDELDLYMKLVEVLKTHDPDIVLGYEIELLSWGYVLQRATALNIQISVALSRVIDDKFVSVPDEETIQMYGVKITGRIVLNLWRVLKSEITLNVYSYENVHFHVLHERIPSYTHRDLNCWFNDKLNCWRTISFYLIRVEGCLRILNKLNLVEQYSELARVFGIQFYEVLSRGTQFRVESMMSRTAKAYNYIMVSPSVQQKVKMRAPEMIALTMEPESNLFTDPVVVLDFQSLYPSIIIAYNYCYSTCLGRLEHFAHDKKFSFGCCSLYTSKSTLVQHINNIHIAPNAVAFLKPEVRRGVLPQMLTEILETRVMVKNAMKANDKKAKPNKALRKLLNARQLGLKLIANVTYGYTGANFSGRMPCVEIADAIVSKGRETLERAIDLVNSTEKWGGKVIYGDTDSLFILFRGCTKEEAFKRGHEIADTVTAMNPKPVKLKFEKVFMPCVLETKKRYVGFSYESVDQKEPLFDAKGIETVRRDTCPAASKILEKSLKILFTTLDIPEVKSYVQRQFQKILSGRISNLQDFVFAKEYRGREKYAPNACVPALQIANKLRSVDPGAEPRKHERVPYVIVYGSDDQPLIELVRQPLELITNPSLRLNVTYYIERVIIPPLNRVFKLMKVDVIDWFKEIPRKQAYQKARYHYCKEQGLKPKVISEYFTCRECPVCKRRMENKFPVALASSDSDLCVECANNWQLSALAINGEIRDLELKFGAIIKICQSCNGSNDIHQSCRSIDCPQLFRLAQTNIDLSTIPYLKGLFKTLERRKASLQF